jgi:hypothetical protein
MIELHVRWAEFHTILAALRFYQHHRQYDPAQRSAWTETIATNSGASRFTRCFRHRRTLPASEHQHHRVRHARLTDGQTVGRFCPLLYGAAHSFQARYRIRPHF